MLSYFPSLPVAIEQDGWGHTGLCAKRLCECDRHLAQCLRRYPCPTTKAVCTSSPWRLLQNIFMLWLLISAMEITMILLYFTFRTLHCVWRITYFELIVFWCFCVLRVLTYATEWIRYSKIYWSIDYERYNRLVMLL